MRNEWYSSHKILKPFQILHKTFLVEMKSNNYFFNQMQNIVEYVKPCFLALVELKTHLVTISMNDGWFFLLQVELK